MFGSAAKEHETISVIKNDADYSGDTAKIRSMEDGFGEQQVRSAEYGDIAEGGVNQSSPDVLDQLSIDNSSAEHTVSPGLFATILSSIAALLPIAVQAPPLHQRCNGQSPHAAARPADTSGKYTLHEVHLPVELLGLCRSSAPHSYVAGITDTGGLAPGLCASREEAAPVRDAESLFIHYGPHQLPPPHCHVEESTASDEPCPDMVTAEGAAPPAHMAFPPPFLSEALRTRLECAKGDEREFILLIGIRVGPRNASREDFEHFVDLTAFGPAEQRCAHLLPSWPRPVPDDHIEYVACRVTGAVKLIGFQIVVQAWVTRQCTWWSRLFGSGRPVVARVVRYEATAGSDLEVPANWRLCRDYLRMVEYWETWNG